MENVTFIELQNITNDGVTKYAITDNGNGEFTSMTKATYDAMQAEQSTPNLAGDEA
jgi:hypothetical protein